MKKRFRAAAISSTLFTTAALIYDTVDSSEVSVTRDGSGYITQVQSRDVVLKTTTINSTSYKIDACLPSSPSTPFLTYTVSAYTIGSVNGIRIDKLEDGTNWSTVLVQTGTGWLRYDWRVATAGVAIDPSHPTTTSISGTTSTVTYGSGDPNPLQKTKTFTTVAGRSELASVTWGLGTTSAPVTTYDYFTNGFLKAVVEPTGKWRSYDYFTGATDTRAGLIQHIYRPWLDAPADPSGASTSSGWVETYDYTTSYDGTTTAPASRVTTISGATVGKITWTYNWSYTTANTHTITRALRQDYASSGSYLTTTTLAYREDDATSFYRSRPHAVSHPDGTKEAYAYYFGSWDASTSTFTPSSGGADRLILTFHGQTSAVLGSGSSGTAVSSWTVGSTAWTLDTVYLIPSLSTVTETVVDTNGRVVFSGENLYTGGSAMERIAAKAYAFNGNNLLATEKDLIRSVAGGDVTVGYTYSAGLRTTKTDVDGTQTAWHYDTWLRNDTLTTAVGGTGNYPAKTQDFTYYSSGLKHTSQDCSCSPTVTTYNYESTGRPSYTTEPKPGGGTLTTSYSYPDNLTTIVTLPNNATKSTALYLDGRIKEQGGTAQVDTRYAYNVEAGTGNIKTTTQHGSTQANGWREEKTDWLGRIVTQRSPQLGGTSSGSSLAVTKTFTYFTTTGQLQSIMTTDDATAAKLLPDHLYVYGTMGLLAKEGDDINGTAGQLDPGSSDRILLYDRFFYKDTPDFNGWIQVALTQAYRNATDLTTIARTNTRWTRFNNGALMGSARVLSDVVTFDAHGRTTAEWEWVDPTTHVRTHYRQAAGGDGTLTDYQDGYLQTQYAKGGLTTYKYNALGLLASTTGPTGASLSYTYHSSTKYIASHAQTIGASSSATTTYDYSWGSGSTTVTTTDAEGGVSYTEYNALGLLWHTWGTALKPTETSYDAYGRRTGLRTWQTGSFSGSTWPSPSGGNLVTWNLDSATGAVSSKVYPDSSSVVFTYNARGQIKTRKWARGATTTYNYYDSAGSLTGELQKIDYDNYGSITTPDVTFTYTRFGSLATVEDAAGTRTLAYDAILNPTSETYDSSFYGSKTLTATYDGYTRPTGYSFNGSSTVSATYDYDANERPHSVNGVFGGTGALFAFGYTAGTDWVSSTTSRSYSRATPLTTNYDVIASATTSWSGVGTLGSFTADNSDSRGWRKGQTFGASAWSSAFSVAVPNNLALTYGFDAYGQLTGSTATVGGTTDPARSFGWDYDLAGNRTAEHYGTGVTNTTYTAGVLNQYTAIGGTLAESTLTYDADGNLTEDGTWTYTYDGENRLQKMSKSGQTLTFTYDYLGRRIRKVVTGTDAKEVKYLWSGWQLAAELAADGSTVTRTFVWGPDFSDGRGQAGGAGSLLAQIDGSTVTYAVPDVLGNIVGYVNASGTIVAAREFTSFGRVLYATSASADYPIGYSGQYTDAETGLVYYGLRYYSPRLGRFVNRDPIEEAGGNNLYGFVGNSPVNGWDVLGMDNPYNEQDVQTTMAYYRCSAGEAAMYLANPMEYPDGPMGLVAGVAAFQTLQGLTQSAVDSSANQRAAGNWANDLAASANALINDPAWSVGNAPNSSLSGAIAGGGVSLNTQKGQFNASNGSLSLPASLSVAAGSNGVIIQKIVRSYNVVDASGKPVQSFDPKVNGATTITYYEAWQVANGKIGITVNGKFYPAATDTFSFAGWPSGVASGSERVSGTMVFVSGGAVTKEYQQDTSPQTTWWSGNLPYTTPNAPQAWNPSGGVVRQVTVTYDPSTQTWSYDSQAGHHP